MKKIFVLIFLLLTLKSQAQFPNTQTTSSPSTLVKFKGGVAGDSAYVFSTSYGDTTAANRGWLKNIPGVMIRVGDNLYLRNALATKWNVLANAGGGVNIYNSDGTLTGHRTVSGNNNQMDLTGFSDFNISSNGGLGISYSDGIYGSVSMTHNTGAVGFDISHLASAQSSTINFGTGFLNLATDNSYARIDQTDIKLSTASLQLLNIPRLGQSGKRVLVKDATTNQVSEVAIDSIGGGGQTLQSVTANGDSTTKRIITNDTLKSKNGIIKGALIVGDTVASGKIWVAFGNSVTVYSGLTESQGYVYITSKLMGWSYYNRGIAGTTMSQYSAGDSSAINRLYLIPTYSSLYSFISCEYGLNDANLHGTDTATYRASVNRWIDTCIARGWPLSRILIIGPSLATKTTYLPGRFYALVGVDAANKKSVLSTNMWDSLYARGGGNNSLVATDSIHPTALGQYNMSQVIYNTVYSFPRVGNFILNGGGVVKDTLGVIGRLRTGTWTPSSGTWQFIIGGKSVFGDQAYFNTVTNNNSASVEVGTSVNQVGVSIHEGTTNKETRTYGGRIDVVDGSTLTYLSPGTLNIGSSDISFIGGSGYEHFFVGRFGGVISNGQGISNGYFKVKGSLNKGYLLFSDPSVNRVGINDSLPQQTLSVRGSGKFTDSLILSGIAASKTDTSANKPVGIDASGNLVKMASWFGVGGGSGNNVYIQIDKTWDSTGWARNDSTIKFKSQEIIVRGSRVTASGTDSTNVYTIMASDSANTYTPTLTNTTNIAASTAYTTYWRRIGDMVEVWGEVDIDATTAATISEMGMSLPITTDIVNTYDLAGTAAFEDNTSVQIKGDVTNNRAKFRFSPVTNTNNKYSFHFTYKFIAP